MGNRILIAAALLFIALPARVSAEGLSVGDAAPKLEVKEFVKGEPVKELEKGKTYVVEFWATWCGPCIQTIPHLTELQKKHKDVTFIGVSISEPDQKRVKPFVEKMGDKMDYRVACDLVKEGQEGAMSKHWMSAAGQNGIPTAFIVNGDNKVAWIGHPSQMEKPLDQIVSGKYDLAKAAKAFKNQAAGKEAANEFFQLLGKNGDVAKIVEIGDKLVSEYFSEDAQNLNQVAWMIVDPQAGKRDAKLVKLALKAAQRADELTDNKDPAILDTLGKAYFDNGDVQKALDTQERAVKYAKGTPYEKDPDIQNRLEQYRKAKK